MHGTFQKVIPGWEDLRAPPAKWAVLLHLNHYPPLGLHTMSVWASSDDDNPHVKAIRSALNTEGLPFATGIKDVKQHNLVLYYDSYIGGPVMHWYVYTQTLAVMLIRSTAA